RHKITPPGGAGTPTGRPGDRTMRWYDPEISLTPRRGPFNRARPFFARTSESPPVQPGSKELFQKPCSGWHGRLVRPCSWHTGSQAARATPFLKRFLKSPPHPIRRVFNLVLTESGHTDSPDSLIS